MPEIRVLKYELLNPHINDSRLKYNDEEHKYFIDDIPVEISVSGFVHSLFKPFIDEVVIGNILRSSKIKDPAYEYYNMNAIQIKQSWVERARLGTVLHYDIESFYNNEPYENNTVEFQYFLNFYRDFSYLTVYRTEWRIFCKKANIAGTIDMLFRDISGNYLIFAN